MPKPDESNRSKNEGKDNAYFGLMEIAGTSGRYQMLSLLIWSAMWFITGSLLLGTPFFFYNPVYSCEGDPSFSQQSLSCLNYVCAMPRDQRQSFRVEQVTTIAT